MSAAQPTTTPIRVLDLHCDTLDCLANGSAVEPFELVDFDEQSVLEPHLNRNLQINDLNISLDTIGTLQWCQSFAIFISDRFRGNLAWHYYQQVHQYFVDQLAEHSSRLAQVQSSRDIDQAFAHQQCAALLAIEGAAFFTDSLAPIAQIAADGVKLLTLVWNGQNALASGIEASGGLSNFGRQVVAALEQERIIVDVSHLNDEGFGDLLNVAERPFIASHSNSRALCGHPRNLTDDQFRAIRDRGGIVGLNYYNRFLVEEERPATPDDLLRHLDHWLELGGERAIALGSDYDGSDIADWLRPCSQVTVLRERASEAFGTEIANQLFFENAYRFFATNL